MELGDAKLKVVRASIGFTQASGLDMGVNAMSMFAGTQSNDLEGGRVLQLLNMVTAEELIDNDDYEGMRFSLTTGFDPVLTLYRNLRRHPRRVLQIRYHHRDEDPSPFRWQPAEYWCGQDLPEVRKARRSKAGA